MTTSNFQKHTSSNPFQRFLIERYFSALQKLIPCDLKTVLDVGCGEGFLLEHLPPIDSYTGVDYSDESIQLAKYRISNTRLAAKQVEYRNKIQNIKFQKENIYHLSFADKSFNLVTCLEVLEHLKDYEKALAEIKRVAKKHIILSVPNEPWFQLSNFLRGKYLTHLGNHPEHINKWNPNQFSTLVSKYFKIIKNVYPFPWQIYLCEI